MSNVQDFAFPGAAPHGGGIARLLSPAALATAVLHAGLFGLALTALRPGPAPLPLPADAPPIVMVLMPSTQPSTGPAAAQETAHAGAGARRAPAVAAPRAAEAPGAVYVPGPSLEIGPLPAGSPQFPLTLDRPELLGRIVLRVYVSMFGLPDRVEILGKPNDEDMARQLRRALENTSFLPGRSGGHDVAAFVDYEFTAGTLRTPLAQN
jgi:hypothetical protein